MRHAQRINCVRCGRRAWSQLDWLRGGWDEDGGWICPESATSTADLQTANVQTDDGQTDDGQRISVQHTTTTPAAAAADADESGLNPSTSVTANVQRAGQLHRVPAHAELPPRDQRAQRRSPSREQSRRDRPGWAWPAVAPMTDPLGDLHDALLSALHGGYGVLADRGYTLQKRPGPDSQGALDDPA